MFYCGSYAYQPPDTANVIYPAPVVYISRNIFSDLQLKNDTSDKHLIAVGCVLHELTHYYQFINFNYISYRSSGDYHAYFCQQYELDAFAVEAFYYLSRKKPPEFRKLLKECTGDNVRLKRELIRLHSLYIKRPVLNAFLELECP